MEIMHCITEIGPDLWSISVSIGPFGPVLKEFTHHGTYKRACEIARKAETTAKKNIM